MPGRARHNARSTTPTCATSSFMPTACSIRKPASTTMADTSRGLSWRFVEDWLRPQWGWFALGVLFAAIAAACASGYIAITTLATDWLKTGDDRVITIAPAVIIALVLLRAPAIYWQTQ